MKNLKRIFSILLCACVIWLLIVPVSADDEQHFEDSMDVEDYNFSFIVETFC